ncbi:hypothetical protein BO78DRAFT_431386 [Aspergillus sclerotiicarbonarius CBS 121057]|uniref:Uncharacterized protein n=1 Tax=Aspergillus sclerotiicarbonarius (strain CBS 121057 / IBT 28362) TaxID=1448318 RepID=A0A319E4M1_ASPSB|nr:hypothetical protein BO78DRAFT_431386 [Aspergillus sclerotiicarbonarius CBS 121057]
MTSKGQLFPSIFFSREMAINHWVMSLFHLSAVITRFKICEHLTKAIRFAANDTQARYIIDYLESFIAGSLDAYRRSMKRWVGDYYPSVESIFGFVEPYRDPYGTAKLTALVENSTKFMQTLPWATANVNNGKGPFEKDLFNAPSFSILHAKFPSH